MEMSFIKIKLFNTSANHCSHALHKLKSISMGYTSIKQKNFSIPL
jgi:hypothetical protein